MKIIVRTTLGEGGIEAGRQLELEHCGPSFLDVSGCFYTETSSRATHSKKTTETTVAIAVLGSASRRSR
jgi:hypothetical protein